MPCCNNSFHERCIIKWNKEKKECPVCRNTLYLAKHKDTDFASCHGNVEIEYKDGNIYKIYKTNSIETYYPSGKLKEVINESGYVIRSETGNPINIFIKQDKNKKSFGNFDVLIKNDNLYYNAIDNKYNIQVHDEFVTCDNIFIDRRIYVDYEVINNIYKKAKYLTIFYYDVNRYLILETYHNYFEYTKQNEFCSDLTVIEIVETSKKQLKGLVIKNVLDADFLDCGFVSWFL